MNESVLPLDPPPPLLDLQDLNVSIRQGSQWISIVRNLSFSIRQGETLGVVGESGSGKSVSMLSLMNLLPTPPFRCEAMKATFGTGATFDLIRDRQTKLLKARGKEIGMIFQDPQTSLNPYLTIGDQLTEALLVHGGISKKDAFDRAVEELHSVGIPNPKDKMNAWPHQFSGGMKQRVMIAMALLPRPKLIIADEPTTALDVVVQRQIVEVLEKRREELGTAMIFISHDLPLVLAVSERVAVMHHGDLVELSTVEKLKTAPEHPYTQALFAAMPDPSKRGRRLTKSTPSPSTLPEIAC